MFHSSITRPDGSTSGHSMAVEGYATIQKKSSGKKVQTLMVYDGWGTAVRFLNFDLGKFKTTDGTAFKE